MSIIRFFMTAGYEDIMLIMTISILLWFLKLILLWCLFYIPKEWEDQLRYIDAINTLGPPPPVPPEYMADAIAPQVYEERSNTEKLLTVLVPSTAMNNDRTMCLLSFEDLIKLMDNSNSVTRNTNMPYAYFEVDHTFQNTGILPCCVLWPPTPLLRSSNGASEELIIMQMHNLSLAQSVPLEPWHYPFKIHKPIIYDVRSPPGPLIHGNTGEKYSTVVQHTQQRYQWMKNAPKPKRKETFKPVLPEEPKPKPKSSSETKQQEPVAGTSHLASQRVLAYERALASQRALMRGLLPRSKLTLEPYNWETDSDDCEDSSNVKQ